jgi:acyl-CoA dehydrogenase
MTIAEIRVARAEVLAHTEADRAGELSERAAAVAVVAAANADVVDREAKFPQAAIDAAKSKRLLGVLVPREFGGEEASIFDVTDV